MAVRPSLARFHRTPRPLQLSFTPPLRLCVCVCVCHRYSIDPQSDPEALFRIASDTGSISTVMELDREEEQWHNITVIATQRGMTAPLPLGATSGEASQGHNSPAAPLGVAKHAVETMEIPS